MIVEGERDAEVAVRWVFGGGRKRGRFLIFGVSEPERRQLGDFIMILE